MIIIYRLKLYIVFKYKNEDNFNLLVKLQFNFQIYTIHICKNFGHFKNYLMFHISSLSYQFENLFPILKWKLRDEFLRKISHLWLNFPNIGIEFYENLVYFQRKWNKLCRFFQNTSIYSKLWIYYNV